MKIDNELRGKILVEALPYIQKYTNKIIVVKYGGNAMINEDIRKSVMDDIILLSLIGMKIVLVHGGGPEITDLLRKINKESVFINGLRVTDKETIEIVQMVLAGKINKNLVNMIACGGGNAIGLSGLDGRMLTAKKLNEEYGYVGDIVNVNNEVIYMALEKGYIPVISTIAADENGNVYNINADTAASKIASSLNAESLISMTDVKGLLKNKDDEKTLIPLVYEKDINQYIKDGIISGGMIPKIQSCQDAILNGVKKAFIIDGRIPHSILIEIMGSEGIGTMFVVR